MSVLDEYLVDPKVSLLDKTRIQAQVLVPVVRALRAELGKEAADALVRQSLRDWSKQLFAAIGDSVEGSPRRKWAAMHQAMAENTEHDVTVQMHRQDKEALEFDVTQCRFAEFFRALGEPELGACWFARPMSTSPRRAETRSSSLAIRPSCRARQAAPSATSSRHEWARDH
jgi:hypothetical protein